MNRRPSSPPPRFSRTSTTTVPPSYHSSAAGNTPSYTRDARSTEQVIAHSVQPRSTGTYNKPGKNVCLSLAHQEPDCPMPQFGRGAVVEGTVTLDSEATQNVVALEIKIEGDLKLAIAEGGTNSIPFLSHSIPLFYSATGGTCPAVHAFSYRLPLKFDDDGHSRGLPPTYEVNFRGVPGLRAVVRYWITVKLVRKKIWKRKEILTVPFKYVPRARPPQPLVGLSFLSSLKSHPEEWSMFSSTVPPRHSSSPSVVTSSFILPSTPIFPMSRNIPFHLQLELTPQPTPSERAGTTVSNTSQSMPPSTPDLHRSSMNPSVPFSTKAVQRHQAQNSDTTPKDATNLLAPLLTSGARVRVTLQRQISIDVRNQKVLKTIVCGEGLLQRVKLDGNGAGMHTHDTPGASGSGENHQGESRGGDEAVGVGIAEDGDEVEQSGGDVDWEKDWAGWEGEVVPSQQIQVGGFRAGGLVIRDFIILNLVPPNPHTSPLRAHQHAVPVRIVTDAWEDEAPAPETW